MIALKGVWWLLAWVAGIAAQLTQPALFEAHFYELLCALALVGIGFLALIYFNFKALEWRPSPWVGVLVGVVASACLGFGSTGLRALHAQQDRLSPELEGQTLALAGRVDDLPRATPLGWRFVLAVDQAHWRGQPVAVPSRVLLNWVPAHAAPGKATQAPRAGETWRFDVRLRQPHGLANPHASDPELWMWEQGLGAAGHVRMGKNDPAPQRVAEAAWGVQPVREHIRASIWAAIPDARTAGVLAALVVGDQAAIERADWDVFRATGVAHLMSISGLHITLWAWLTTLAVSRLWRWAPRVAPVWGSRLLLVCPAPLAAAWGGWWLALGYAVFSGWGVPAQRTVVMLGVVVGLRLLGRFWPWPVVALAAMATVLAWDPWAWLQAGFWLSFVAVSVLMAGGAPAGTRAPGLGGWAGAASAVGTLVREQGLITLALAPLTLVLFGQTSVVGLVANLVAIPVVTFLITPLALAGVLLPGLWGAAVALLQALMQGLAWLSGLPWAALGMSAAPLWLALFAVLGGVLLAVRLPVYVRVLGLALVVPLCLYQPWRPAQGEFELVAADVGQGSAVLVRTAAHSVVLDAGPLYGPGNDAGQRVLLPLLAALGDVPSHLVFSHRDTDHVGGSQALLAAYPQAQVWASFDQVDLLGRWGAAPVSPAERAAPNPPRWTRCQAGQGWELDGVRFEVLHPTPALYAAGTTSSNNLSCVVWVRGRSTAALITGDLEAVQEGALVRAYPHLQAHVLMAPHHGSKTSSSPEFLAQVQPAQVLVQAGYRSRYGHPAPVVTQRYQQLGVDWVATPNCGAARWRSDAPSDIRCQRTEQRRYWHWQEPSNAPTRGTQAAAADQGTEVDDLSPERPAAVWPDGFWVPDF